MAVKVNQSWIKKAESMHSTSSAKSFINGKGGNAKKQYSKSGGNPSYGRADAKAGIDNAKRQTDDFIGQQRIAEMKSTQTSNARRQRIETKSSSNPFVSSGSQGLDKIRFMESRGAKPSDQSRRSALSGDMRRNFSEQGGINRVGVSALRGAAVGGVAGGTVESMQGGDFWDGAKSGAFYGATGMAGVRATRQAVGAQSYLGKNGIMGTMKMNKEQYGVGVKDLMLNQQNVGRAKDMMNSTNKKKK